MSEYDVTRTEKWAVLLLIIALIALFTIIVWYAEISL